MKTPINSRTLRQHLTYSWWKYAILIVLGAILVNLYYTVTVYRSPADKVIELYVYGYGDQDALDSYMSGVRETDLPEMESMHTLVLTTDATYGVMQLTTYIAAGEGDLYMLPRDQFVSMAASGTWIALEEDEELMNIFTEAGVSLQSGWRRNSEEGTTHLYGIPLSALPGLEKYAYVENGFLSVLITGGNTENSLVFLRRLCRDMVQAE